MTSFRQSETISVVGLVLGLWLAEIRFRSNYFRASRFNFFHALCGTMRICCSNQIINVMYSGTIGLIISKPPWSTLLAQLLGIYPAAQLSFADSSQL